MASRGQHDWLNCLDDGMKPKVSKNNSSKHEPES